MGVNISISIAQNSQNVANNTSNVTVKVIAKWDYGSYNKTGQCTGSITIDGTKHSFTGIRFNSSQTNSGSETIMTKTVNVTHDSEGKKTLKCSAIFNSYVSSGTVEASASKTLTTIPRKSTLSASNGTLDTAQTLTVTRKSTSFTHTITYKCGSASDTIVSKSTSTSISWKPPLSLAQQNTTGTSVSVTLTITTYNGSASVGSNSITITCGIPSSVKPSVFISVSDPTENLRNYGQYVQGQSKIRVVATASGSQGSTIKSYSTKVDDNTYTAADITTDVIAKSGTLTVTTTVTDSRGRTASTSAPVSVTAYAMPKIRSLSVNRCDENGNAVPDGGYMAVVFSSEITPLYDRNTAAYTVEYKKKSKEEYTTTNISSYSGQYVVTNGVFIFAADVSSGYDVRVTVSDAFQSVTKAESGSSARKLFSVFRRGLGWAFGKIAELEDVLDIGFKTRFYGGLLPVVLEAETDLNDVLTPNTYTGENVSDYNYANCPVASGTFTLLVESCGEAGQIKQTYCTCSKYKPERYSRFYYQGEWGDWFWAGTDEVVLYENDSGSDGTITLGAALSHFRYVEIYFTDNNNKTGGYTKVYRPDGKTVCLQISEANGTAYSRQTMYTASGTTLTPNTTGAGYYTISASSAVVANTNRNLIKIVRVIGRA